MNKLARFLPFAFILTAVPAVFAQRGPGQPIPVQLTAPAQGINPVTPVATILSNALTIIFIVAALLVLFFLIIGAFNWITSGGDKEKIGKARGTIVNALIGLAILALAALIVVVVGRVLNINIFDIRAIPTLDTRCPPGQSFDPTIRPLGACRTIPTTP